MEHRYYAVTSSDEFKDAACDFQKRTEEVLPLPVSGNVRYIHAVRFAERKYVIIEGVSTDTGIVIPLDKFCHTEKRHQEFKNETQFFFGGNDDSRYVFRNLTNSCATEVDHLHNEETGS